MRIPDEIAYEVFDREAVVLNREAGRYFQLRYLEEKGLVVRSAEDYA